MILNCWSIAEQHDGSFLLLLFGALVRLPIILNTTHAIQGTEHLPKQNERGQDVRLFSLEALGK